MQEKRHDRVVEMRLCFFLGKVGDYNVSFAETRMCRSTKSIVRRVKNVWQLMKIHAVQSVNIFVKPAGDVN